MLRCQLLQYGFRLGDLTSLRHILRPKDAVYDASQVYCNPVLGSRNR
jgi:hypothetical protein